MNLRGNLYFIRWKRFEIVCWGRLKRMEIKREKEIEFRIRNEIYDFFFDLENSNCLDCIIILCDFLLVCLKRDIVC